MERVGGDGGYLGTSSGREGGGTAPGPQSRECTLRCTGAEHHLSKSTYHCTWAADSLCGCPAGPWIDAKMLGDLNLGNSWVRDLEHFGERGGA